MPGAFCQCIDQSSAQLVPTRLKQSKILTETFHCLIGGGVCSDVKKITVKGFFLKNKLSKQEMQVSVMSLRGFHFYESS